LGDRNRHLQIVTGSASELFRVIPSFTVTQVEGTVSACNIGWFDPSSGALATLEYGREWNDRAVRVYDASMRLLSECTFKRGRSFGSCPSLSRGGKRVAFLDGDANVVVADMQGDTFAMSHIAYQLPAGDEIVNSGTLEWIGENALLVPCLHAAYYVDVTSTTTRTIECSEALGCIDGGIVDMEWGRVVLTDLGGRVVRTLGSSGLSDYSGCWIRRVSPDGRFLAYEKPVWLGIGGTVLAIEDLQTGRQAHLRGFTTPIRMGSWHELPSHAPAGESPCTNAGVLP
jgi:Tol biopolymer transport system component